MRDSGLPRPVAEPFLERALLDRKARSPASAPLEEEPARPLKRATPRSAAAATTHLFSAERGTFVMHRVPTLENLGRVASVFSEHFSEPRRLGSGSYGTVYDATYCANGLRYAVKIFNRKGDRETKNEVKQVSFLQSHPHPNCLTYYFAWSDKKFDEYGIVTELCTGSLKALLHAEVLPEERVWEIFLDLLNGIAHIHANGLRHLDIKPENVFLTKEGVAKIGDFGIACALDEGFERGRGTAPYSAPETREESGADSGLAADMFSLGVVLYEMVSDYDLAAGARAWQPPPSERQFGVLASLASELMAANPLLRPSAALLLARPELASRAAARLAAASAAAAPAPATFPLPLPLGDVAFSQFVPDSSARLARSLFDQ